MPTIKDVALRAGVSVATASRALRNIGYLSPKTEKKVKTAAKDLGYFADRNAQQLKLGKSNSIGVIVSDMNNHFYNFILAKLESYVKQNGSVVLITSSFERAEEERKSLKAFLSAKVTAIIFTPVCTSNRDLIDIAKKNGIKVIQLYRKVYEDVDSIIIDDDLGAFLATTHLLEFQCKKPLLIDVKYKELDEKNVSPSRTKGYLDAIRLSNIEPLIFYHPINDVDYLPLRSFIEEHHPDGIVCGTNNFGMEVLQIFKEKPANGRIGLVVFDDLDWANLLDITSIKQSINLVVEHLINAVFDHCQSILNIRIPPVLIERKTGRSIGS